MTDEMTYGERYTRYQLERSPLRRLVRGLYLHSATHKLQGPTVDFGCGVGELLKRLPKGSLGLEINPVSVEHCRAQGLDAMVYDAEVDGWSLALLEPMRGFQSLVVSHVLEHLTAPMSKLSGLLRGCHRLGISRVLVIVPGRRGYSMDDTHRTFVDLAMLSDPSVIEGTGYTVVGHCYFPCNIRTLGNVFPHHELQVLYRA